MLLSFVFKDSQQQQCFLRNMIIECHVRTDLSLPGARANQIAISLFCPLFHLFALHFNKNSKATNQSDLRNNAEHVIKYKISQDLAYMGHFSLLKYSLH